MSTFTIDSDNNVTYGEVPAGNENLQSFASEKELAKLAAEWPSSRLVDIWNSFAGVAPFTELKPVKKFTDRKSAVARILAAIQRLSPTRRDRRVDIAPEPTRQILSPVFSSQVVDASPLRASG